MPNTITIQQSTLTQLTSTLNLCTKLNINDIEFNNNFISGINLDHNVIVYSSKNEKFPFDSMCVNRIKLLQTRLDFIKEGNVQATITDKNIVSSLYIHNNQLNSTFRCAARLRVPPKINDVFDVIRVDWNSSDLDLIKKGLHAIGNGITDVILESTQNKKMSAVFTDMNGDVLKIELSSVIDYNNSSPINHTYNAGNLLTVLNMITDKTMLIGRSGFIKFPNDYIDIFLANKVGNV